MFLHGGIDSHRFHMMSLMQLGPALEELYGSARYFFCTSSPEPSDFWPARSSDIIHWRQRGLLGLVGAMLAITSKRGGSYMRELRSRLISSVVILFVLDLWAWESITGAWRRAGFRICARQDICGSPADECARKTNCQCAWLAGGTCGDRKFRVHDFALSRPAARPA